MLYRFSINDLWLRAIEMKYTTFKKKEAYVLQKSHRFDFCPKV